MMTPKQATRYFAAKLEGRPSELTEARYAGCKTQREPSGNHMGNMEPKQRHDSAIDDQRFSMGTFNPTLRISRPGRLVNGANSKRMTLRTHRESCVRGAR